MRLNRFRHLIEERQRADLLDEEKLRLVYDLHDNLAQRVSSVHQRCRRLHIGIHRGLSRHKKSLAQSSS